MNIDEIMDVLNKHIYCNVDDVYVVSKKGVEKAFESQQKELKELREENKRLEKDLKIQTKFKEAYYIHWEDSKERVKELEGIIKEAINLPKGIEPHSYSNYKTNKTK